MFTTLVSAALFSTLAIQGCQNAQITWDNTNAASYNLIVVPSADPCNSVIADLGDHTTTHITWKVQLAAGTDVMLSLEDSNGDEAWSGAITVEGSNDTSCLPGAKSSEAAASTTASSASHTSSTTAASAHCSPSSDATTTAASTSTSSGAVAVGAANAGIQPFGSSNGAFAMRQLNTPVLALSAVAALFALSL
ncbi:hypothetical protein A0H81_07604 [Grifola frondosa]|uniref:Uncharacterized protein n=1 Tax=Grifola frondosa TaxID=5627 RepID=A0A1C7M6T6_GRIFR|nr:hypothetical protein A0H81_07604 [Grifola frondosa]